MKATAARFFVLSAAVHGGLLVALTQIPAPQLSPAPAPTFLTISLVEIALPQMRGAVTSSVSATKPAAHSTMAHRHPATQQAPAITNAQIQHGDTHTATSDAVEPAAADALRVTPPPSTEDDGTATSANAVPIFADMTANGDVAEKQAADTLRERVRTAVAAHFVYPPLARRQGWEGEVKVGLRVNASGELSDIHLLVSSGHLILDRAALRTLAQVQRVGRETGWLEGRPFDMVLPIHYQLIDG